MNEILSGAITLFIIMDPLGNIPIFLSVLAKVPEERRMRVLARELVIALVVMMLIIAVGEQALNLLQLETPAVQIAGGIVLFLIAIRMIFPPPHGQSDPFLDQEPFIVPLAIPLTAGPSVLATLLLMVRAEGSMGELVGSLLIAWLLTSAVLLLAPRLFKIMGNNGLVAIERLMGMILIAIAVQMLMDGVEAKFGL